MEITTTYPKHNESVKQGTLPDQKKMATLDGASGKNKPIVDDSVLLSKESLELSLASTVQGNVKTAPIENGEQAGKAVAQVVSGIRNNPGVAKQIQGNIFQVNLKLLLE